MKYECQECKKQFIHPTRKTITTDDGNEVESTEYSCCPYCGNRAYDEIKEQIQSVKEVKLDEVDGWLQKGYEVHNLYSKNAILVKKGGQQNDRQHS
jgi:DNA-directed RNA polymerase subunit RPC12/RpoP